jgi:hypothetical protein
MGITTWSVVPEVDEGCLEIFVPIKGIDGAEVEREDVRTTSASFGGTVLMEKMG